MPGSDCIINKSRMSLCWHSCNAEIAICVRDIFARVAEHIPSLQLTRIIALSERPKKG
jgi:hypothetical protein